MLKSERVTFFYTAGYRFHTKKRRSENNGRDRPLGTYSLLLTACILANTDLGKEPYLDTLTLEGYNYFVRVRVSGPTFITLFMFRVSDIFRVILDCDLRLICVHRYSGIISEDASC